MLWITDLHDWQKPMALHLVQADLSKRKLVTAVNKSCVVTDTGIPSGLAAVTVPESSLLWDTFGLRKEELATSKNQTILFVRTRKPYESTNRPVLNVVRRQVLRDGLRRTRIPLQARLRCGPHVVTRVCCVVGYKSFVDILAPLEVWKRGDSSLAFSLNVCSPLSIGPPRRTP